SGSPERLERAPTGAPGRRRDRRGDMDRGGEERKRPMPIVRWLGAAGLVLAGVVAGGALGVLAAAAALALANVLNAQNGIPGFFAMLAPPAGAVTGAVVTTWLVTCRMGPSMGQPWQGILFPASPWGTLAAVALVAVGISAGGVAGY